VAPIRPGPGLSRHVVRPGRPVRPRHRCERPPAVVNRRRAGTSRPAWALGGARSGWSGDRCPSRRTGGRVVFRSAPKRRRKGEPERENRAW